ncbi:MAG: transglycosylase domain-containing protein [Deltaproteobacteria bacterium]
MAKILWGVVLFSVIGIAIIFLSISKSGLPSFEELENPDLNLASLIYDTKGREIGKYYYENRVNIAYDSINPFLVQSLLATEDARFFDHSGVDLFAVIRVFTKTVILRNKNAGGGSTITQQLAKLLFERPDLQNKSYFSRTYHLIKIKLKEWLIAIKLEKSYTKEEIIAMYLNKFDFIYGAHGIQAASRVYFGKDQKDLSLIESAVIIGMLKNPSLYNPVRNFDRAIERRNVVLAQLNEYDELSDAHYEALIKLPIDISNFNKARYDDGPAPYFRMELTKWLKKTLNEKKIRKPDGTEYNIYTDGLKIYTTLDIDYQKYAEIAVYEQMKILQKRYFRRWKGMDPMTYEAEEPFQIEKRKQSVESKVINSDRYQRLKNRMLSQFLVKISQNFDGLVLNEKATKGLIEVKDGKKSLEDLIKEKTVNPKSISKIKNLLNHKLWNEYLTQWIKFQNEKEKQFSTKVRMKVFAYNSKLERDTLLSPLDSVLYHIRHLQAGVLAMESGTGKIRAWVGGTGFRYFKFDHINNRRQVGSTFKPIVYATAIAVQGISPCQEFDDIPYSIIPGEGNFNLEEVWSPNNSTETFTGNKYNLYHGLLYSKNSITVKLVKELGNVEVIREVADNMGIDKNKMINGSLLLPKVPAIALGSADISLMEMTGAYGTFSNDGIFIKPYFVSHIEDKNGKVIYTHIPEQKRALNPVYNYIMVDMLKNNMAGRFSMYDVRSEIGGKTGTTNDFADGWFISVTPEVVIGVWTGGDEKWVRFYTLDEGQGYTTARPIVQKFLSSLEKDKYVNLNTAKRFKIPADKSYLDLINCRKYKTQRPDLEFLQSQERNSRKDEFEEEFDEETE